MRTEVAHRSPTVSSRAASSKDLTGPLEIDRHKLAGCTKKELGPLKRWLASRAGHRTVCDVPPDPDVVVLPATALAPLATLADCKKSQLIDALRDLVTDRS